MQFDKRTGILMFKPPISWLHVQTQCLPCPPLFHRRTSWTERFLQALVTGIVTSHKRQKIPSPGKCLNQPVISIVDCLQGICDIIIQHVLIPLRFYFKCSTLSRTSRGIDLGCVVVLKVRIFFQEGGRLLCCTDETILRSQRVCSCK